jgi:hypothetical protein
VGGARGIGTPPPLVTGVGADVSTCAALPPDDLPRVGMPPTIWSTDSVAEPATPVKNSMPRQRSVSIAIMCWPRWRIASHSGWPRSLRSIGGIAPR